MQNESNHSEISSEGENELLQISPQDENIINSSLEKEELPEEGEQALDGNDGSSPSRRNKKSYKHAYQEAVRQAEYYRLIAEQQAQQLNTPTTKNEETENSYQDPITKKKYASNSPEAIVSKILMEREQEINNTKIQEEIQRKTTLGKAAIIEAKDEIEGFEDQYQSVFSEISGDTCKAIRHEILASHNAVPLIQYYARNLEDLKRIKSRSPDDQFREVVITSHSLKKKPNIIPTANPPLPKPHPQRNTQAPKVEDPSAIFREEMQRIRNPIPKWGE